MALWRRLEAGSSLFVHHPQIVGPPWDVDQQLDGILWEQHSPGWCLGCAERRKAFATRVFIIELALCCYKKYSVMAGSKRGHFAFFSTKCVLPSRFTSTPRTDSCFLMCTPRQISYRICSACSAERLHFLKTLLGDCVKNNQNNLHWQLGCNLLSWKEAGRSEGCNEALEEQSKLGAQSDHWVEGNQEKLWSCLRKCGSSARVDHFHLSQTDPSTSRASVCIQMLLSCVCKASGVYLAFAAYSSLSCCCCWWYPLEKRNREMDLGRLLNKNKKSSVSEP